MRLTLIAALLLAACGADATSDAYQLAEFVIEGPGRLAPGPRTVTVGNEGDFPHTLVVTSADGQVVAASPLLAPGQTTEIALELHEGRYSFTCRIVAENDRGQLVDHYEAGMSTMVVVEG